MKLKHIEVEQKYQLPDPAILKERLQKEGANRLGFQHQRDVYYNAPHRNFLATPNISEWLRLREEDGSSSINYKRWLPIEAKVKTHCDEFESTISDREALRKLLEALNFTKLITVDKQREEWRWQDIVIALDNVEKLGWFVEFEYKGMAESITEAHSQIETCIKALNVELGERNHVGYPYLLLAKRDTK